MRHCLVALIALIGGPSLADSLDHIGTYEWTRNAINGMSGIEVLDRGERFHAISDLGWYVTGRLKRTDGQITGVGIDSFDAIRGHDNIPRRARRVGDWSDAEGLAVATDGTIFIAFERWAHVARFAAPDATAELIKDHPGFLEFSQNRQLEALAIDSDGTVFVFPEQPKPGEDRFPVFALVEGAWDLVAEIPQRDRYAIVGADFDDVGRLYLLERKLVLGMWWQNRMRRFESLDQPGEVLWTTRPGAFYNIEGISVWSDGVGRRITMISDNNRDRSEPTQIIEFRLTE